MGILSPSLVLFKKDAVKKGGSMESAFIGAYRLPRDLTNQWQPIDAPAWAALGISLALKQMGQKQSVLLKFTFDRRITSVDFGHEDWFYGGGKVVLNQTRYPGDQIFNVHKALYDTVIQIARFRLTITYV